jgi:hypothetical protein
MFNALAGFFLTATGGTERSIGIDESRGSQAVLSKELKATTEE